MMTRQRSGAIVAVASTSAVSAPAGQANYAASKAGLLATVRVLAKELGPSNVRVNAVVPGFVETAMTRAMPAGRLDEYLEHIPLRRIGQPEEVADLVVFLLSAAVALYHRGVLGDRRRNDLLNAVRSTFWCRKYHRTALDLRKEGIHLKRRACK